MDKILGGLDNVICYLDDILIKGINVQDCYRNLCQVLDRLKEFNVKLNISKCTFFADSVKYLGHRIDAQGLVKSRSSIESS